MLLTCLAMRTTRLRLRSGVMVVAWHNPVLLAEQAATLDLLSGGRLDFGIGSGYRYNEFSGFDVGMEEAREKFEESIGLILKAWTSNDRFSHKGKYWTFNDVVVEPPPFRRPHPVVWMGAGSDRSIRDVARRGFNLLLGQYASPDDVAHNIAIFRAAVEATGQTWDPMRVGVTRAFFVSESEQERDEALDRRLANRLRQLKLATTPDGTVLGGPDRATGDPIEINLKSAIYGTPDQIAQKLRDPEAAGVGYALITGGGSGGGARGLRSLR